MTKDWKEIHEDFAKTGDVDIYGDGLTYQQLWEAKGFTKEEAQTWIQADFVPEDYDWLVNWRNQGFTAEQTWEWLSIGLVKHEEELASYFRQKKLTPSQAKDDLEQLIKKYNTYWLNEWYPVEERKTTEAVYIGSHLNLRGTLIIQDFPQLKEINCVCNSFTSLVVLNCPQLSEINCHANQLTSLEISACPNLSRLICSGNQLANLDFLNKLEPEKLIHLQMGNNEECQQDLNMLSRFARLEYLEINNSSLYGSLEPLNSCRSLKWLGISDTDIDFGLEYLPDSVETFYCFPEKQRPESKKVKVIEQELRKFGESEDENFASLLPAWKKVNPEKVKIAQHALQIKQLQSKVSQLESQLVALQVQQPQILQPTTPPFNLNK